MILHILLASLGALASVICSSLIDEERVVVESGRPVVVQSGNSDPERSVIYVSSGFLIEEVTPRSCQVWALRPCQKGNTIWVDIRVLSRLTSVRWRIELL